MKHITQELVRVPIAIALVAGFLLLAGCDGLGPSLPGNGDVDNGNGEIPDVTTAEELYNEAIALMEAEDVKGAYTKFAASLQADATYLPSILGISIADLILMAEDANARTYAKDTLGWVDYPDDIADIISETWLIYVEEDEDWGYHLPRIEGMEPDEMDEIAIDEWVIEQLRHIVQSGTFLNVTVDTVSGVLGTRLDNAVARLKALPSDLTFTFTKAMIPGAGPDDFPDEGVTVGRAEALLLAAQLQAVRTSTHFMRVLDLTLPLQDYFDLFIEDVEIVLESPFTGTFLNLRAGAQTHLNNAKASVLAGLSNSISALDEIRARTGSTFALSPESSLFADDPDEWTEAQQIMATVAILNGRIKTSIEDNEPVFIPTPPDPFGGHDDVNNWPNAANYDEGDGDIAIAINFAPLFDAEEGPMAYLLHMEEGEPVVYEWDESDEAFEVAVDFSGGERYALKIPDITLGGIFPLDEATVDFINEELEEMASEEEEEIPFWLVWNDPAVSAYIFIDPDVAEDLLKGESLWAMLPELF